MGRRGKKGKKKGRRKERGEGGDAPSGPVGDPLLHAWPDARLDLHGRSVSEAGVATRNFLMTQSRLGAGRIVHVLTGKGTGALFRTVGDLLADDADRWVDEAAPDLQGAGWRIRTR